MISPSQMLLEITQQPAVMQRLLDEEWATIQRVAALIRQRDPRFILLAARGSSDNAARYGQYLFGAINRIQVALATPSLFTLYGSPPRLESSLVLAISQSGQSPDIVAVAAEGRRQGALTVAITNDAQSPLAQAAEHTIRMLADQEKAVAATKTYTASLMTLAMLSAALNDAAEHVSALQSVPAWITAVLDSAERTIRATERYRYMQDCVVDSRGYNIATAFELALKLKELTHVVAEPYSAADFQHGPVAVVEPGFPVLAIVPEGRVAGELLASLKEVRERGAELVIFSALEEGLALAKTALPLPARVPEWLSPLVAIVQGQLFALGLTLTRGLDPDHPRGLHKVTLTR